MIERALEPAALMTTTEIAQACGVRVQTVSQWAGRHSIDFPAARKVGNSKKYPVEEVASWLDRYPITRRNRQPHEDAATYGPRFRQALGLPSAQLAATGSVPTEDARRLPGAAAATGQPANDPWAELIDVLTGSDDKAKQQDVVTALLWLRWSDPAGWLGAARAHQRDVDALKRSWHVTASRFEEETAPELPNALAEPWWRGRLFKIATTLETCLRSQQNYTSASMAAAFEAVLDRLAEDRRKGLGWYLTPAGVAQTMVRLIDPQPEEVVFDPCCGYGELLVAAGEHILTAGGSRADLELEGLAHDNRALRIAEMNAAIHDLPAAIRPGSSDLLRSLPKTTRKADVIVTNPPFGIAKWTDSDPKDQPGWKYGPPLQNRPSFAWLQLVTAALTDTGRAAVVMPSGATDPGNDRERAILRGMIEADVIRCVISLPKYLFRETAIQTSIWILEHPWPAKRRGVLLIDGTIAADKQTSTHMVLAAAGQARILAAWRSWSAGGGSAVAEPGFAATPTLQQIRDQGYVLAPARYLRQAPPALVLFPPAPVRGNPTNLPNLREELARLHRRADDLDGVLDSYLDRIARKAAAL